MLLPAEFFYAAPFVLGPVAGAVCGLVMSNLRVWHGLLLGLVMGPVAAILTVAVAILAWVNTGTDEMTTGGQQAHLVVMAFVIPVTCGLCFWVSKVRED